LRHVGGGQGGTFMGGDPGEWGTGDFRCTRARSRKLGYKEVRVYIVYWGVSESL
jgi:hypothetical protein